METNEIMEKIGLYFQGFPDPKLNHKSNESILSVWPANYREIICREILPGTLVHLESPDLTGVLSDVYRVEQGHVPVVVYVKDEKVLWLDNHQNDDDFTEFLRLKNPRLEKHQFLTLLLIAKIQYVSEPRLISTWDDIPPDPYPLSPENLRRVQQVKKTISPPRFQIDARAISTDFFIWTRMLGRIYQVKAVWDGDTFHHEGTVLIQGVGDHFMPR